MEGEVNNYISLQEAVKFCNYSQEYLSLRARQSKLKAIKLGRNWMTTKEWLGEYLQQNGKSNELIQGANSAKTASKPKQENNTGLLLLFFLGLATPLIFILIFTGIFSGVTTFSFLELDAVFLKYQFAGLGLLGILQSTLDVFGEYIEWIMSVLKNIVDIF